MKREGLMGCTNRWMALGMVALFAGPFASAAGVTV